MFFQISRNVARISQDIITSILQRDDKNIDRLTITIAKRLLEFVQRGCSEKRLMVVFQSATVGQISAKLFNSGISKPRPIFGAHVFFPQKSDKLDIELSNTKLLSI